MVIDKDMGLLIKIVRIFEELMIFFVKNYFLGNSHGKNYL